MSAHMLETTVRRRIGPDAPEPPPPTAPSPEHERRFHAAPRTAPISGRARLRAARPRAVPRPSGADRLAGARSAVAVEAWYAFTDLAGRPVHDGGPERQGHRLQLGDSLGRAFQGFALAAILGVPLGMLIGANRRAWQAANPVIQLLRPVSPLAWFPLGLVVLKDSPDAAVFVIFITSLWPIVLNTAAGASSVPADQRNVARVFRFGRSTYLRHVLFPHTMPSIDDGAPPLDGNGVDGDRGRRDAVGGSGIGFFVWDSYNGGNLASVIAAIVLIGVVGVALDAVFLRLVGRRDEEATAHEPRVSSPAEVVRRPARQRRAARAARCRSHRAPGRVRLADRSLGLRQVDAAQRGRRA